MTSLTQLNFTEHKYKCYFDKFKDRKKVTSSPSTNYASSLRCPDCLLISTIIPRYNSIRKEISNRSTATLFSESLSLINKHLTNTMQCTIQCQHPSVDKAATDRTRAKQDKRGPVGLAPSVGLNFE